MLDFAKNNMANSTVATQTQLAITCSLKTPPLKPPPTQVPTKVRNPTLSEGFAPPVGGPGDAEDGHGHPGGSGGKVFMASHRTPHEIANMSARVTFKKKGRQAELRFRAGSTPKNPRKTGATVFLAFRRSTWLPTRVWSAILIRSGLASRILASAGFPLTAGDEDSQQ